MYFFKCGIGDKVNVRVGGDFFYSPSAPEELPDLILIGGGVGINPLLSMLLHHVELAARHSMPVGKGSVHLLYSSKTQDELLFQVILSNNFFSLINLIFFIQLFDYICALYRLFQGNCVRTNITIHHTTLCVMRHTLSRIKSVSWELCWESREIP